MIIKSSSTSYFKPAQRLGNDSEANLFTRGQLLKRQRSNGFWHRLVAGDKQCQNSSICPNIICIY